MKDQTFVKHQWHCPKGHNPYQTIAEYPEYEPPKCLECGEKMQKNNIKRSK